MGISWWQFHHPNWRTLSFFRGVAKNHQADIFVCQLYLWSMIPHDHFIFLICVPQGGSTTNQSRLFVAPSRSSCGDLILEAVLLSHPVMVGLTTKLQRDLRPNDGISAHLATAHHHVRGLGGAILPNAELSFCSENTYIIWYPLQFPHHKPATET